MDQGKLGHAGLASDLGGLGRGRVPRMVTRCLVEQQVGPSSQLDQGLAGLGVGRVDDGPSRGGVLQAQGQRVVAGVNHRGG